jgi:hypothetical protein
LHKIIPDLVWDKRLPFPLNNTWGYHDAATGNGRWDLYYKAMVERYGESESMEEFCDKMQLMNATGYQAIFEAAGHKLNDIGGVMLWKLNAAFPSVVWQVYDWFLMPNAGYYSMQNACEPVHIQLNLANKKVTVLNRTYKRMPGLVSHVNVYDLNSKSLYSDNKNVSLNAPDVTETTDLSKILGDLGETVFVVLNLKNAAGEVISHNIYWISSDNYYRQLNKLAETVVTVTRIKDVKGKNDRTWTFKITNSSDRIAFFIRPQLISGGEELLPCYWSENYFTLAPSESTTVTVTSPVAILKEGKPILKVSGWNVAAKEMVLE